MPMSCARTLYRQRPLWRQRAPASLSLVAWCSAAYTAAMSMNLVPRGKFCGSTLGISMVMTLGSVSKEVSECQ